MKTAKENLEVEVAAWFTFYGKSKIQLDAGTISIEELYQMFANRKNLEVLAAIDDIEKNGT